MASLETLQFAKDAIRTARLKSEQLVSETLPSLTAKALPVEMRMFQFRAYVTGVLNGQDDVLKQVRQIVPEGRLKELKTAAAKVTAPAEHWSAQFDAKIQPIVAGNEKGESRAKTAIDSLAKRIRDLMLWEGILDQLIAGGANGETKPAAKPVVRPAVVKQPATPAAVPEDEQDTSPSLDVQLQSLRKSKPAVQQEEGEPLDLTGDDVVKLFDGDDDALPVPESADAGGSDDEIIGDLSSTARPRNDHDTSDDFQLAPTEPRKPA